LAKRSIEEVIDEWYFSVWREDRPGTPQEREASYNRLFDTLSNVEGYGWDDWSIHHDKLIKEHTVGNKGTASKRAEWTKAADIYIKKAKIKWFGTRGEIASGTGPGKAVAPTQVTEQGAPSNEESIEQAPPKESKLKEYVPNQKALEEIDKNFKFEFTDEDIE